MRRKILKCEQDKENPHAVKCGEGLQICTEHGRFAVATLLIVNEQGKTQAYSVRRKILKCEQDKENPHAVKRGEGLQICTEHGRFAVATLLIVNEQGESR